MTKLRVTLPSPDFYKGVGILLFFSILQVLLATFGISIWSSLFLLILITAQGMYTLSPELTRLLMPLASLINTFSWPLNLIMNFPFSLIFAFFYLLPAIIISYISFTFTKLKISKLIVIISSVVVFYIASIIFSQIVIRSDPNTQYRTLPKQAYEHEGEIFYLTSSIHKAMCFNNSSEIKLQWSIPENNAVYVPIHTPILAKVTSPIELTIVPRFILNTGKGENVAVQGAYYTRDTIVAVPANGITPDTMSAEIAKLKKISYEDGKKYISPGSLYPNTKYTVILEVEKDTCDRKLVFEFTTGSK